MSTVYATRATIKARLAITDTSEDAVLDAVLVAVSREIEQWTGRCFHPAIQTRYYTATHDADASRHASPAIWRTGRLMVDDLLSITTLATDEDGDRVYETTWASTDYDLAPYNAPNETPPQPYSQIEIAPNGRYGFTRSPRGISILGKWGYYDVRVTSSATTAEALDASETGVDVSSGAAFEVGQTILIDSEQMEITAISTNTLTVVRGCNGTTAAAHSTSAPIDVYTYPVIAEACLHQATLLWRAKDAPTGIVSSSEFGGTIQVAGLHPLVRHMLQTFRRPVTA